MSHQADWQFFKCKVNGHLSSIFTDLGLASTSPISECPELHWLWVKLRFPDDRGLSTDEEFEDLCRFEDELGIALSDTSELIYVGRITGQGRREFYFYGAEETNSGALFSKVLSAHPEYKFQVGAKPDPGWSHYLSLLYPGENGMRQIQQRVKGGANAT